MDNTENDTVCPCYSCSQYRNWDRMEFLKKNKRSTIKGGMSKIALSSEVTGVSRFDCLPDDLLIDILKYIWPKNIDHFLTLIGLQMVSKRFHRCMIKVNEKIWGNMTELVLGFHPNLPLTQYLCHIGHITLVPFLRRVPKITKVILNFDRNWSCPYVMEKRILPVLSCFAETLKFSEMEVMLADQRQYKRAGPLLFCQLLKGAQLSLETFKLNTKEDYHLKQIGEALAECSSLKKLKISIRGWFGFRVHNFFDFYPSFKRMQSVESLEIIGFLQSLVTSFLAFLEDAFPNLQTLRLTYPKLEYTHSLLQPLSSANSVFAFAMRHHRPISSVGEFEIHTCVHSYDLRDLPNFMESTLLTRLMITFYPSFHSNKTAKVVELLQNNAQLKDKDRKISITFLHSDVDKEAKLTIIRDLLDVFDVSYGTEEQNVWEFIRGRLCVILKLEKIQDASLICHFQQAPPLNNE